MNPAHTRLDDDALDRAALHALDCLRGDELEEYQAHLAGCALCRDEVAALSRAVSELGHLVEPVEPEPALFDALRRRIAAPAAAAGRPPVQTWKGWAPDAAGAAMMLSRGGEGSFEPTGVEGVEVRRLFVDVAGDRATMLVRMQPGARYPRHRHGGAEECYVLSGDLKVGDITMHAGDYQRASEGSEHPVQSTAGGCLLFIVSSLHDDLLDASHPA